MIPHRLIMTAWKRRCMELDGGCIFRGDSGIIVWNRVIGRAYGTREGGTRVEGGVTEYRLYTAASLRGKVHRWCNMRLVKEEKGGEVRWKLYDLVARQNRIVYVPELALDIMRFREKYWLRKDPPVMVDRDKIQLDAPVKRGGGEVKKRLARRRGV